MRTVLGALLVGASLGISASLAQAETIRLADAQMDTVTAAGASAAATTPTAVLKARERIAELRKEANERIEARKDKVKKDRVKRDRRAERAKAAKAKERAARRAEMTKRSGGVFAFASASGQKPSVSIDVTEGKGSARVVAIAQSSKSTKSTSR